ncbi:MAG: hypothetical protein KIT22_06425 [Verrucomicrobiae bacterium]|nr:hypothetical protein [Verrucomicrobiae bacterium]
MNPAQLPIAIELFAQWRRLRGGREEGAQRPFSRPWEVLLEEVGLLSAIERNEAERDARNLAADGWLELRTVRYKPHLLERVVIPREQEERWSAAFGFSPPSDAEAERIRAHPWHPDLAFVRDARIQLPFEELEQLNRFLTAAPADKPLVPIKERSLEVLGDEKRLDVLRGSSLFRSDRLDLERHLRCQIVGEPLGWKRGPQNTGRVLIIENAATWHSYCRWNEVVREFSALVYGRGLQAAQSTRYLGDILAEIPGPQQIFYFGDLDPPGLQIPQQASAYALGLPPLQSHRTSYRWLLDLGLERSSPWEGSEPARREDCDWLGDLADEAWTLLSAGRRLAQEHIGWEFLREQGPCPDGAADPDRRSE